MKKSKNQIWYHSTHQKSPENSHTEIAEAIDAFRIFFLPIDHGVVAWLHTWKVFRKKIFTLQSVVCLYVLHFFLILDHFSLALPKRTPINIFKEFVIFPLVDLGKSLCKRRPRGLHWLILMQISVYALYTFGLEEYHLRYLFMSKIFHGFGPVDFAIFSIYRGWWKIKNICLRKPIRS